MKQIFHCEAINTQYVLIYINLPKTKISQNNTYPYYRTLSHNFYSIPLKPNMLIADLLMVTIQFEKHYNTV